MQLMLKRMIFYHQILMEMLVFNESLISNNFLERNFNDMEKVTKYLLDTNEKITNPRDKARILTEIR